MKQTGALGIGLVALLVSACSGLVQAPPPAPSTADYNLFHARMLDLTWAGFALLPALDAPPVTPGIGFERTAWGAALRACMLVSIDELNYVYNYYARWTVPCLTDHGYKLRRMLSREQFVAVSGQWVPYWELPIHSAADHERVTGLCGPDRPPLSAGS